MLRLSMGPNDVSLTCNDVSTTADHLTTCRAPEVCTSANTNATTTLATASIISLVCIYWKTKQTIVMNRLKPSLP